MEMVVKKVEVVGESENEFLFNVVAGDFQYVMGKLGVEGVYNTLDKATTYSFNAKEMVDKIPAVKKELEGRLDTSVERIHADEFLKGKTSIPYEEWQRHNINFECQYLHRLKVLCAEAVNNSDDGMFQEGDTITLIESEV